MSPADILEGYLRERDELISRARPGLEASASLSRLTDRAVSAMAEAALAPLARPWAVLALGGWGAGRLLPGSDLDLLVVTDAPASELAPAISGVLYPLWDAALDVGHQVRSPRDHVRVCRTDLTTLTATLTGRVLAGDHALGEKLLDDVARAAHKRGGRLLRDLRARERTGSPYLLEPDLKEGAGGQRDLDELVWCAAAVSGRPATDHHPLVTAGVLDVHEAALLDSAAERITAGRWALHRLSARDGDRLALDALPEQPADAEELQRSLADAAHLLLRARARLGGAPLPGDSGRPTPLSPDDLFELLDGDDPVPGLEDAAWSGRLDDLVPGLADAMSWRRPALTHRYTVGAHSLRAAARVGAMLDAAPDPRTGAGTADGADTRRTAQFAALVHDLGKATRGPGHAERGAAIARTLAPRLGLTAQQAQDAAVLVREHLLLPETATTQDVHDEDVVLRAAEQVGAADLVAPLLALTAADAEATGPGTWTPWTAALLGELADRITAELAGDLDGAGTAGRAEQVRAAVLSDEARGGAEDVAVADFARRASLRYLAAHSPEQVVAHARLADSVARSGDRAAAATEIGLGPAEGTWRVTVAAIDRPGLFAIVAGTLSLSGLDILTAQAHSAPGGIALDAFIVRPDTLATPDDARWNRFERQLRAALSAGLDIETRVSERASHYPPSPGKTSVWVDTPGAYATAVHVSAPDRVGLLYSIASAIAEEGLDIRWVSATTRGGSARDVFHVVDADGEPVTDHGALGHLAMRIRTRAR